MPVTPGFCLRAEPVSKPNALNPSQLRAGSALDLVRELLSRWSMPRQAQILSPDLPRREPSFRWD